MGYLMRMGLRVSVATLGLAAQIANAQSPRRLIVLVGQPNDLRMAQQRMVFEHDMVALRERDVVVQEITPDKARRDRAELGVNPHAAFEVLLVGKDGGVKLRRLAPVEVAEMTTLIDKMPMRQEEMAR